MVDRLIRFYRGFGFVENKKGKNKIFEIFESMYRGLKRARFIFVGLRIILFK